STRELKAPLRRTIRKYHRLPGIHSSLMCERTQRPGSGCTSTGAIALQKPIGLIHSTRIFPDGLKVCCSTNPLGALQKATQKTKVEFGYIKDSFFSLVHFC